MCWDTDVRDRFGFINTKGIILKYCWTTAASPLALSCRLLKTHQGIIAVSKGRQAARPMGRPSSMSQS